MGESILTCKLGKFQKRVLWSIITSDQIRYTMLREDDFYEAIMSSEVVDLSCIASG